ncbi:MAG: bifunctional UDP-N-acetylmuramoyl-tripeptide:D-alanyl-D-alanine ligase/alanine racemase [Flavobacterium sp.]|nr:bifunctional UDP-N-acetylmuramoyl-tripeptide:D-alanyl-D-alanine ligase/alanine racemase [Flavobacterium sp.]
MNLSVKEITQMLGSESFIINFDDRITNLSIDSRSLQSNHNTLFFTLVGNNHNAHRFIEDEIIKGVRNFVVQYIPEKLSEKANFFIVENTISALHDFAIYHRKLFNFPVIGVTGSNGKTIVKEWLSFLLSPDYNIIKNPKSYNSQVGVPLSVIGINQNHNFGIFEAGISTNHEMENLEKIICPTIGVLTNIGSAHDEGFKNIGEKISEKLKLFKNVEILIYKKNKTIDAFLNPLIKTFSWSCNDKYADVFIKTNTVLTNTVLNINYEKESFDVKIPFQDDASIENAISSLMVLLFLKFDKKTLQTRMSQLYPLQMRLQLKNGINNCNIIDDSYSSDFQSLKIALDFLENQKQHKTKTIIISDIFQSGLTNDDLYAKVSQLIIINKINKVIAIGEVISGFKSKFPNCKTYTNTDDFIADFRNLNFANENILIKGARQFEFEKIVTLFEEKTHETVLEINLNAISHNLNYYKSKLQPNVKMMVMVKAFGYGNGGYEIAKLLEHHKVDYLGVAFADEGIALKNAGISLPIMVLNPEATSFLAIIENNLEPEIYSFKGLNSFLKIAKDKNLMNFPIHIKLDTGMHRLGFQENDLESLISILEKNKNIEVKSILSHMATSDDKNHLQFANYQIQLFENFSLGIIHKLKINPIRHLLNTSGISNFPDSQYNMVRLGIGLYGISNDNDEQKYIENVSTLKSVISQIRTIESGESVGYGRRFIADRTTRIATIPIGYADGISRSWGNELGFVNINNKKAIILGSVCMDMLMVDVSEINCQEGDRVIVFGEFPTVKFIAHELKTIPYEILTSISQRVKRVFYRE